MLDHHETAAAKYGGYGKYADICCNGCTFGVTFEEKKSGAGLAFDYIFTRGKNSFLFTYQQYYRLEYLTHRVQDRDLWNFEFTDTQAVYELLNSIPMDLEAWYKLVFETPEEEFKASIDKMQARADMRQELAADYAAKATIVPYKDKTIAVLNCASNFASAVGDILGKTHAFAVMFVVSPKDNIVICSLRSNKETGEDVFKIATKFGGGGHINAAGFSFNFINEPGTLNRLVNGELFRDPVVEIGFDHPINSWQDIFKIAAFYKGWRSAESLNDVGHHVVVGEELKMIDRIREFYHSQKVPQTTMDIIESLLNEDYMKEIYSQSGRYNVT